MITNEEKQHSVKYGSDLIAELIADLEIPFVALNPGASFRGLHDSLINHPNKKMPEIITCTHEEISVAIAHGYAKATGKPMAVATHNIVGLQHASMAIFNAWCDRVPVLIFGGTGPVAADKRRPWIDWIHTALVQGNFVRDFVKWDDQPMSIGSIGDSIYRAYRLSVTEPAGPVYVCFDTELQEKELSKEETEGIQIQNKSLTPTHFAPGTSPAADNAALKRVADAIIEANFPVIATDYSGRSEEAFYALAQLSEKWAIPVLDKGSRLNLSTIHPMNLTGVNDQVFEQADLVLVLDDRDIFGSFSRINQSSKKIKSILKSETRVFSIGLQDYGVRSWSSDYQRLYPTEESILADTKLAIAQLKEILDSIDLKDGLSNTIEKRKNKITAWHKKIRGEWKEEAKSLKMQSPIHPSVLADKIWEVLKDKDFVLVNGKLRGWTHKIFEMVKPRQYLGFSGGGGLGYGIGATIGACLAHKESGKLVVNIQSDGDFLFTSSGLWTFSHHKLPALIIMDNNRTYFNSQEHQRHIAKVRNRDESRCGIGTNIDNPNIDYAAMARSMGIVGIGPIDSADGLTEALQKAVEVIEKEKRAVLIDVLTEKVPY